MALSNLVDFIVTCITHPQAAGVSARLLPVPVWALQAGGTLLGKGDAVQRLCGNLQVDIAKARALLGGLAPVAVSEGLRRAMGMGEGGRMAALCSQ